MNIKTFKNEYEVTMLEIKEDHRRPVHISERKVQAILLTNELAENIKPVKKHGRDLFEIKHVEGDRTFTVGEKKIRLVLDNAEALTQMIGA